MMVMVMMMMLMMMMIMQVPVVASMEAAIADGGAPVVASAVSGADGEAPGVAEPHSHEVLTSFRCCC